MKVHLIVPCSASKTVATNQIPSISEVCGNGSVSMDAELWLNHLSKQVSYPAHTLYSGTGFLKLLKLAEDKGLELSIMSAGMGLLNSQAKIPTYQATFAEGEDAIPHNNSEWWDAITTSQNFRFGWPSFTELFKAFPNDAFIISCSKDYLFAVANDLEQALDQLDSFRDQVAVISSELPPKLKTKLDSACFLKAGDETLNGEGKLHSQFGLPRNHRHSAVAATHLFVSYLDEKQFDFGDIIARVSAEISALPPRGKPPKRIKMGEDHVKAFLRERLKTEQPQGKGRLHKEYRDSGYACSDENFRKYFNEIKLEQKN